MSKQHFTDDFVLAIQKDSTLDEQAKSIIFRNLARLKDTKVNILITGATGRASALGHHMGSSPSTRTRSSSDHAVALRFMRKLILPFFPIGTGRTKFSTIFFNNDRFCGA